MDAISQEVEIPEKAEDVLKRAGIGDPDEWDSHMGRYKEALSTVDKQQTTIIHLRQSLLRCIVFINRTH